jgi:hypothetical protein
MTADRVIDSITPQSRHSRRTALALLMTVALGCAAAGPAQAMPEGGQCAGQCPAQVSPRPLPTAATLKYEYQVQQTYYWCAAASARIALTARGKYVRQADLASYMRITPSLGLPNIGYLRDALNHFTGTSYYQVKQWSSLAELRVKLRADVMYNVARGHAVVLNVNRIDSSTFAGHYAPIVGYRYNATEYLIADPASASRRYIWRDANTVASWVKLSRYVA